jgi:paraquat-inducible protein A
MNQMTIKTLEIKHYHACHACDLLVYNTDVSSGEKAICPRCGSSLYQTKENTVNNTLALVITGLLLLYPAIALPIMEMTIIGDMSFNTLLNAVIEIYKSGYYWIAFMVLFTSILTPAAKLVVLLIVLLHIKFKRHTELLPLLFRYYVKLDVWEMLDVYMIAMLVSVIKLFDIAAIKGGWGLYCFVGLLLTSILVTVKLDKKQIWECIEDLCKKKNN